MKTIVFYFFPFLLFFTSVFAQEEPEENLYVTPEYVVLKMTVKDSKSQPVKNIDIIAYEKGSTIILKTTTDNKGKAELILKRGKTYQLDFPEKPNFATITTPKSGPNYFVKTFEYNASPNYQTEVQLHSEKPADTIFINSIPSKIADNESKAHIKVLDQKNKPLEGIEVKLYSKKLNRFYIAKTQSDGIAHFVLPNGTRFSVSIEEMENIKEFSTLNVPGANFAATYYYEPTQVNEILRNDTFYQQIPLTAKATSSRVLIKAKIMDFDKNPLPNEPIFLTVENSQTVYTNSTNEQGIALLLVPKGKKYILNFKYERNVDILDYTEMRGFRVTDIEYEYIGSAKIENYYKTVKRSPQGFITEFMSIPVSPNNKINFTFNKTENGYELTFPENEYTPSPAIVNGKIFISEGFYSRNLYSLDAESGKLIWSVELGEKGSSNVVYEDGIILVNTESCTLYALEASTGRLLWSKWLGTVLYSSPSVANGRVYAIYPNDLNKKFSFEGSHVLVCFDLKTGNIIWQNWLDEEAIACPVIAEGGVYLTTLKGTLYAFSEKNGNMLGKRDVKGLTPPTIKDGKVYLTVRNSKNEQTKSILICDANNLSEIKEIAIGNISNFVKIPSSSQETMSHNGSRPFIKENYIYSTMDDKIYCFTNDGKKQWVQKLTIGKKEIMPIVVGDKVIATTTDGTISIYSKNGSLLKSIKSNATFWTEPIINNGWIYCGTVEGKMLAYNTNDKTLTGWNMWNGSGNHNTAR